MLQSFIHIHQLYLQPSSVLQRDFDPIIRPKNEFGNWSTLRPMLQTAHFESAEYPRQHGFLFENRKLLTDTVTRASWEWDVGVRVPSGDTFRIKVVREELFGTLELSGIETNFGRDQKISSKTDHLEQNVPELSIF